MILNFKVLNILIISNIFFSNIEIFSVYLAGSSFDSFKNVTKKNWAASDFCKDKK